ncbi:hypothetical protein ASG22_01125 [Chryseobacterium sp. Leaf405]|uniref:hypothetical protein n=1 Tax=Chryseobacterium sp. Leaf405 TaxID=1736367 RepID=UPI000700DAE4|nr:hypothetical protein [Chryseobacterium sp. Leaf405]KQT35651.1 hypothetical protein ASG22_01125 [Chryseobacterium sp. Leaf405]
MNLIKIIPFVLFSNSCFSQTNSEKYIIDDGIMVEKPDGKRPYDEIYNNNNIIYTHGKKFTYSYFYQDIKGEKFLIKKGKEILQPEGYSIAGWEFVKTDKQDKETINHLILKPKLGNPFERVVPDYNQTAIGYEYVMANGEFLSTEETGAIENEMNVWIHPPRNDFFKILEINPFPYIKAPYQIGTKWNWSLEIGDHWSDKRWLEWKGGIENQYTYEIKDKKNILTKLGNLECYVVHANANNRIGKTELISYFNPKFGFVKLEYTNIDNTKTVLELEKID